MRFISESGAGAVITNHADYGRARRVVDAFEPEEYRQVIEEVHDQVVFRDHPDAVPMYTVWNFRDFGTEKYKDVRNTKGLLTYAGFKKDVWYLYRSFLRPQEPVVHLTSKTYFLRRGRADDGIKAYSNAAALTLTLNGVDQGSRAQRRAPARQRKGRGERLLLARRPAPRPQRAARERRRRARRRRRRPLRAGGGARARRLRPRARAPLEQPEEPGLVHRPGGARPVAVPPRVRRHRRQHVRRPARRRARRAAGSPPGG